MPEGATHKLLNFIISSRLSTLEEKQAEFATRAIDPGNQPEVMSTHDVEVEEDAARRLFAAFYGGLQAAAQARAQNAALVLDDANPQQDAMATALIRFLVKAHLATVETEEVAPGHFRYHVQVDWPALEQTATLAGVDLQAAIAA